MNRVSGIALLLMLVAGLGTAQRNVAAEILVASLGVAGTETLPYVLVASIVLPLILLPAARPIGKRGAAGEDGPTAPDEVAPA